MLQERFASHFKAGIWYPIYGNDYCRIQKKENLSFFLLYFYTQEKREKQRERTILMLTLENVSNVNI